LGVLKLFYSEVRRKFM